MHPEKIKAALRMKGFTQAVLADEMGVAPSSISQAITGYIRSDRIQKRISDILELPVSSLWPGQVRLRRTRAEIEAQRARASA